MQGRLETSQGARFPSLKHLEIAYMLTLTENQARYIFVSLSTLFFLVFYPQSIETIGDSVRARHMGAKTYRKILGARILCLPAFEKSKKRACRPDPENIEHRRCGASPPVSPGKTRFSPPSQRMRKWPISSFITGQIRVVILFLLFSYSIRL